MKKSLIGLASAAMAMAGGLFAAGPEARLVRAVPRRRVYGPPLMIYAKPTGRAGWSVRHGKRLARKARNVRRARAAARG